jgi:hypothetical protein
MPMMRTRLECRSLGRGRRASWLGWRPATAEKGSQQPPLEMVAWNEAPLAGWPLSPSHSAQKP